MMKSESERLIEIYITFLKIGCFCFGGGYGAVCLMEYEIVDVKKWIEQKKLHDIFSVSQSLPGAIALNTSAFVGYYIRGVKGALVAILGNLTFPVIIIISLSMLINVFGNLPILKAAFMGIRPVIIALILYAGFKIGKNAVNDIFGIILVISVFCFSLFLNISPITLIILGAALGITAIYVKKEI